MRLGLRVLSRLCLASARLGGVGVCVNVAAPVLVVFCLCDVRACFVYPVWL